MKKLRLEKAKYWGQIFLLPIFWLSMLMPRNKKLWLFGSTFGRRFSDNPKYLYLYLSQRKSRSVNAVWVTKDKKLALQLNALGLKAVYYYSFKGFYYCLTGGVYIYDNYTKDISFWLSGKSLKINLWHGIPLKKIQADNKFDSVRHPESAYDRYRYALRRMSDEKPWHYVLTTSKFLRPVFSSAFQTKRVLTCGYPRTDILIPGMIKNEMPQEEALALKKIGTMTCKKRIVYMPTFRDSEINFFDIVDLGRLKSFMEENNYLFCVKLHMKSKLNHKFKRLEECSSNFIVLDSQFDSNSFLGLADLLVTDYSSVSFDFLWLDRPILYFDYDRAEYMETSREFYFNYEDFTPGEKVETLDQLLTAVKRTLETADLWRAKRLELRDKLFDKSAGNASERLYLKIMELLNKNKNS